MPVNATEQQPDSKSQFSPTAKANTSTTTNPPDPTASHASPSTESQPLDFASYYLQRVTAEFANDLDKVRLSPDFKPESLPVLVQALQQGAKGFSEEEKRRVMMTDGRTQK